jgi:hypothetical protein
MPYISHPLFLSGDEEPIESFAVAPLTDNNMRKRVGGKSPQGWLTDKSIL